MKVISISSDRNLFEENSDVRKRLVAQSSCVREMHVIVFAKKSLGFENVVVDNLCIYPTNTKSRIGYILKGIQIGLYILKKNKEGKILVTTQDPHDTGIVGFVISKLKKIPLQVQVHTDIFTDNFIKGPRLNKIRVIFARFIIPRATGIRVMSRRVYDSLIKRFGEKIESKIFVLPVYMKLDSFVVTKKREKNKKEIVILVVSRFEPEKNVSLSLEVMKKVLDKIPYAKMILVGDGGERQHLERLSKQLGISKQVEFIGWQTELKDHYLNADIFLNTSNYEGYGRTLVEAVIASCAVVTTDVGIVGDVLTKARVCSVGDLECLSSNVIELCLNNNERYILSSEAIKEVSKKAVFGKEIYYKKLSESWCDLF
ncbi:MAG: glycosyltransferase family 4 protein [Candidatus Pacebacteria bacterium]|nr:glycosyltransferase family 4 protein [Candidatus Paceibacterota bacterium]